MLHLAIAPSVHSIRIETIKAFSVQLMKNTDERESTLPIVDSRRQSGLGF